ncbi:GtrA family protein [Pseudonocardia humida]|uniref:GtrA family protein n=1 Tax=Pseudonocardia humida TaxID=2800819 RepID=A0ABT0ZT59_9PSEU|nr:GtrA family protein [Pseudonocardia humida]MCO1653902.1 GtrA family protein [Pseudonocardia humida]
MSGTAATGTSGPALPRFRIEHPLLVQVVRYAMLGAAGTGTNALIFLVLRTWLDAVPANLVALVLSTALSTELNRRFTFGGAAVHRWRNAVQSGGTVLFYAFYSSAVLLLLGLFVDSPSPALESLTVAAASLLGGTVRFLVLRQWVFADDTDHETHHALAEDPASSAVAHR